MKIIRNEEMLYAEQKIQMEVSEICYGFLDEAWSYPSLLAAFTRVYIPLSGRGTITYGKETVELRAGNVYVIPAGLNFSCACPDRMEKLYVHLTLTHPDGSDIFRGIDGCLILPDEQNWAERAKRCYEQGDLPSILEFKILLYELLSHALATAPRHAELRPYSPLTKSAIAYIDEHLSAALTIGEIASALFVSKQLLQKQFKADVEKPLGQYVDDRLMARAEQYLLVDGKSIKEISDRLGFCDQFYFSRKFTQTHGVSPLRFRKIHRA